VRGESGTGGFGSVFRSGSGLGDGTGGGGGAGLGGCGGSGEGGPGRGGDAGCGGCMPERGCILRAARRAAPLIARAWVRRSRTAANFPSR